MGNGCLIPNTSIPMQWPFEVIRDDIREADINCIGKAGAHVGLSVRGEGGSRRVPAFPICV